MNPMFPQFRVSDLCVLFWQRRVEEDGMLMPEFADVEEREFFSRLLIFLLPFSNALAFCFIII